MTEPVRIIVDGPPVGKGRPRFVRATGQTYTPERTANYETRVSWAAGLAMKGRTPFAGPVAVTLRAFMPVPISLTKRQLAEIANGQRTPARIDLDNLVKAAFDGLNGIVWRDDVQVARAVVSKDFDATPRLEIEVREVA